MVPHRLCLRNFLCYRENCEPIDFSGISLACLVGENGHGKSALLDAITWALWGQARARTEDELIHLGRVDMEVELEFRIGEVLYRVVRKRRRGTAKAPGRSMLEFQVLSGEAWKPLTGITTRDTQKRIDETVRLSYDTFCNSAFLMQGRADQFTIKAPGQRKEVLSDILGLQVYETYEARAKEKRNEAQGEARRLQAVIEQLKLQLVREPQYRQEKAQCEEDLRGLEDDLKQRRELLEGLRQVQQARELQRREAEEAERERLRVAERVARSEADLQTHLAAIQRQHAIVTRADEIRAAYAALAEARREESEQAKRQGAVMQLRREEAAEQAEVEREAAALRQRIALLDKEIERLRGAAERTEPLALDAERLAKERIELELQEKHLTSLRQDLQELHNTTGQLQAENKRLRADMDELKRKLDELEGGGSTCPICGTDLGEEGKQRLQAQYKSEGGDLAAKFRHNKATLDGDERRSAALQSEVTELDGRVTRRRSELDRRAAALDAERRQAVEAAEKLPVLDSERGVAHAALAASEFAPEARRKLAVVAARLAATGFDEARLEQARREVKRLAQSEAEYAALHRAEEAERAAREAAARAESDLSEWRSALCAVEQRRASAQERLDAMPDPAERLTRLTADVTLAEDQAGRLKQALGAAEQNLEHCRSYRQQCNAAEAEVVKARSQAQIHEDLATAFGRKGVRALIIDSVLPEIEDEANRLLARMSNGRMTVALSTQRTTQKNTAVETLDISIADELGTRAYELYSGGEAFRINLALRIALSKLLARRAGAPLPTLIVDEGFGTQDAAGRERLMEAVHAVSRDFECLIVITHIDELKDQFDRQIRVEKTPDGSIVTVI